jgi:hypothetical protein
MSNAACRRGFFRAREEEEVEEEDEGEDDDEEAAAERFDDEDLSAATSALSARFSARRASIEKKSFFLFVRNRRSPSHVPRRRACGRAAPHRFTPI